mgnify:CR=1 FL=1
MEINIYDLLDQYEREQLCELVSEAVSRHFGSDRLDDLADFDLTGYLLEEEINA